MLKQIIIVSLLFFCNLEKIKSMEANIFINNKSLESIFNIQVYNYLEIYNIPEIEVDAADYYSKSGNVFSKNSRKKAFEFNLQCGIVANSINEAENILKEFVSYLYDLDSAFVLSIRSEINKESFLCYRSDSITPVKFIAQQGSLYTFQLPLINTNPEATTPVFTENNTLTFIDTLSDGNPATITITELGLSKITDNTGRVAFENLVNGAYTYVITKEGYETFTTSVYVTSNISETYTLNKIKSAIFSTDVVGEVTFDFTFYTETTDTYIINWGDGTSELKTMQNSTNVSHTFTQTGRKHIIISGIQSTFDNFKSISNELYSYISYLILAPFTALETLIIKTYDYTTNLIDLTGLAALKTVNISDVIISGEISKTKVDLVKITSIVCENLQLQGLNLFDVNIGSFANMTTLNLDVNLILESNMENLTDQMISDGMTNCITSILMNGQFTDTTYTNFTALETNANTFYTDPRNYHKLITDKVGAVELELTANTDIYTVIGFDGYKERHKGTSITSKYTYNSVGTKNIYISQLSTLNISLQSLKLENAGVTKYTKENLNPPHEIFLSGNNISDILDVEITDYMFIHSMLDVSFNDMNSCDLTTFSGFYDILLNDNNLNDVVGIENKQINNAGVKNLKNNNLSQTVVDRILNVYANLFISTSITLDLSGNTAPSAQGYLDKQSIILAGGTVITD